MSEHQPRDVSHETIDRSIDVQLDAARRLLDRALVSVGEAGMHPHTGFAANIVLDEALARTGHSDIPAQNALATVVAERALQHFTGREVSDSSELLTVARSCRIAVDEGQSSTLMRISDFADNHLAPRFTQLNQWLEDTLDHGILHRNNHTERFYQTLWATSVEAIRTGMLDEDNGGHQPHFEEPAA